MDGQSVNCILSYLSPLACNQKFRVSQKIRQFFQNKKCSINKQWRYGGRIIMEIRALELLADGRGFGKRCRLTQMNTAKAVLNNCGSELLDLLRLWCGSAGTLKSGASLGAKAAASSQEPKIKGQSHTWGCYLLKKLFFSVRLWNCMIMLCMTCILNK